MRPLPPPVVASLAILVPATVVFTLAYDSGGYSALSRSSWAIEAIWLVAAAAVAGVLPRPSRAAAWVAGLLAAFALLTLLSSLWAANDAGAFAEFNRVAFYLDAFVLALAAAQAGRPLVLDGIALGLVAVAGVALLSRVAPGLVSDRGLADAFPGAAARLSHPVGYWNGLAILVALAVPLLLRAAVAPRPLALRVVAIAPLPAVVAVIYLASSRGGVATAGVGALAFLALSSSRWQALAALLAGGAGALGVIAFLAGETELSNDPAAASDAARATAAFVVLAAGAGAALAYAALASFLTGRSVPRSAGRALAAAAAIVAVVAVLVADPAERFRSFKAPPAPAAEDDFVRSHLASAGGSGRWQFWSAAVDAWKEDPLLGHGAASYEAWWARSGTLEVFVRDAHSLYLETLAELGLVGFALLAAAGASAAFGLVRRRREEEDENVAGAAAAVLGAFAVAAGIEWVWELPVVPVVELCVVGCGLASTAAAPVRVRGAIALVAVVLVGTQGVEYAAEARLADSRTAAAAGDLDGALGSARSARDVQPWSPDPWLQLALVHEVRDELPQARSAITRATEEDGSDWRLWLVAARLETKAGDVAAARRSLVRARELNPRSPLFRPVRRP
jgi:tetratricopeptide (TPR) repeat protein